MAPSTEPGTGLHVLVVDDERPALDDLVQLLGRQPVIGDVAVADNATDALRYLRHDHFDGVFLDIRMPGLDGLELASILSRFVSPPPIVFVSAFEQHAVEAFEVQAVDYLLKPVRPERLADAIERLASQPPAEAAVEPSARVAIEVGGATRFLERDSISFVESAGDYVRLYADGRAHLVRTPISALEEAWSEAGFVRIHRGYLVALRHVTEMRAQPGGGYALRVGDRDLPVSRRHYRAVKDRLAGATPPGGPA